MVRITNPQTQYLCGFQDLKITIKLYFYGGKLGCYHIKREVIEEIDFDLLKECCDELGIELVPKKEEYHQITIDEYLESLQKK